MTPNLNYRTSVCDRSKALSNGTLQLEDALRGLDLSVLVGAESGLFFYDEETGIDDVYPGLIAVLLDELATRAGFAWRNSFAVAGEPTVETWTELLEWGKNTFDVNGNWWVRSFERMAIGITFTGEWYDTNLVLIRRVEPEEISNEVNFNAWLKPFEIPVWCMILFTIYISAVVYMWLEWLQGERNGRSLWEWWLDNSYLSFINSTQAYEYQPTSFPGKIFGVSMTVWALVTSATYTANLASLLVERGQPRLVANNLEEAATFGFRICTWKTDFSDIYLTKNYPSAINVRKVGEEEMYKALNEGECDYALNYINSWKRRERQRSYNPTCSLERVPGYTIPQTGGAFATDHSVGGEFCSNIIRDTFSLHLESMRVDGFLKEAWENEFQHSQSINCELYTSLVDAEANNKDSDPETRRLRMRRNKLASSSKPVLGKGQHHRTLKAANKAASAGTGDQHQLTLRQMIGIFGWHYIAIVIAILLAHWNLYYNKYILKKAERNKCDGVYARFSLKKQTQEERISAQDLFSQYPTHELTTEDPAANESSCELTQIKNMQKSLQQQLLDQKKIIIEQQQTMLKMMEEQRNLLQEMQRRDSKSSGSRRLSRRAFSTGSPDRIDV